MLFCKAVPVKSNLFEEFNDRNTLKERAELRQCTQKQIKTKFYYKKETKTKPKYYVC